MGSVIDKALISHLVLLEKDQQEKVLVYIKDLLSESLEKSLKMGYGESIRGEGKPHNIVMEELREKYKK